MTYTLLNEVANDREKSQNIEGKNYEVIQKKHQQQNMI